jgi:dipeptidyl aminopeptidase/acylaminoacyl peptidase
MRRIAILLALPLCSARLHAQTAPPGTDIYLASLTLRNGRAIVGTPVNITSRPGYDNQPSFTPDSRSILFSSIREDGQSDIYRYDLATRAIVRVTATAESEYSPTMMPGGKRLSVVRVEKDSTQRLWSFALDGSDPELVLAGVKPVGYHAWIDSDHLALFVLGSPNLLLRADRRSGRSDTLSENIGRSLVPLAGQAGFSFTQRLPDSTWMLTRVIDSNGAAERIAQLPRGADYVAWLGPESAITASGTHLYALQASNAPAWSDLVDLAPAGLRRLSRLAVSPDGKWIAIVAEPAAR